MAQPKRTASRRTAAAIAEDLGFARSAGGLWRAVETELKATIDFLSVVGLARDEAPLNRARDLLVHGVRRGCESHRETSNDALARAAATSLEILLTRPAEDTRLVATIRRAAVPADKPISVDAIRHREDKIVDDIAEQIFRGLQIDRVDQPRTMEAAIHRFAPIVADLRQQLHDGLCMTHQNIHPVDPREARAIEGFYRQVVIKLGELLLCCDRIIEIGRSGAGISKDDFWFMRRASNVGYYLFDMPGDRSYMRSFMQELQTNLWEESIKQLLAADRGKEVYENWVEWAQACYPTCAFERAVDINYMCAPHQLVTLLYETEMYYDSLGYSALVVDGNQPILHHGLPRPDADE